MIATGNHVHFDSLRGAPRSVTEQFDKSEFGFVEDTKTKLNIDKFVKDKQNGGDTLQYYEGRMNKHHFIVSPHELRTILSGFHHVIVNTGVPGNYIESNPNDFLLKYDALYQRLKSGSKLVWKSDFEIAELTTGITGHLENCTYSSSLGLNTPDFSEPCPWVTTFCLYPWKEHLSTSFGVQQFSEGVCGLCLHFPTQIAYAEPNETFGSGIVPYTELDDYETYSIILSRIKEITKPLKLAFHGKTHRTSVRISDEAKKDIVKFYFITANNITVI